MGDSFNKIKKGINLEALTSIPALEKGDLYFDDAYGALQFSPDGYVVNNIGALAIESNFAPITDFARVLNFGSAFAVFEDSPGHVTVDAYTTLQQAYDNSSPSNPDIQLDTNDILNFVLGSSPTSTFNVKSNNGLASLEVGNDYVKMFHGGGSTETVYVTDGYVKIDGYLTVTGETIQINTSVTDTDHLAVSPGLSSTVAVKVMPSVSSAVYTANLLEMYDGYNENLVVKVDDKGSTTFGPVSAGTALTVKSTFGQNIFQFLKPDLTNLFSAVWDGSSFHHYQNGNIQYNMNGNQTTFSGGILNTTVLRIDGPAATSASDGIQFGLLTYATTVTPLTNTNLSFKTNAWNGSNGFTIGSTSRFLMSQLSATNNDARFDFQMPSGTNRISILSNGNVGVGTTSPTSKLSVGASSEFQVNSTGNIAKINNVVTSFPSSQGSTGTVLRNDGSGNLSWVFVSTVWVVKTANYTALANESILADTTTSSFSITLPSAPATGETVRIVDPTSNWGVNNLTIIRGSGSHKISGVLSDLTVTVPNLAYELVFFASTNNWIILRSPSVYNR